MRRALNRVALPAIVRADADEKGFIPMNSFAAKAKLNSGNRSYTIYRLAALEARGFKLARLPFSLKILLENLLRREDGVNVTAQEIEFLARWDAKAEPSREIAYMPARVLMQDFTGVPAIVDLAAMRDAIKTLGGDPERVNPLIPAELVIDHSVQVDEFGTPQAYEANSLLEFQRNRERYAFLKWGQTAFRNFSAVPPGMGICHQVNLEYLARVVFTAEQDGEMLAYPDTLVGTDSHTTMINGLGVLGWGVGGIEAEAAMLGQAVSMLVPQVVGYKLTGKLREGATATDLVLTVTQALRKLGVVGKFVEFYGPGIAELPLADRATISNMAPEYGATCGIFPVDAETLRYLRLTGRSEEQIALVEAYYKEQGLFHTAGAPEAEYTQTLELDLGSVEPSVAGPKRPQDRVLLKDAAASFQQQLPSLLAPTAKPLGTRTADAWQPKAVNDTALAVARRRQRRPGDFNRGYARPRQSRAARDHHGGPKHGEGPLQCRSGQVPRSRIGGDCGHHELHQHFESIGDDRRGVERLEQIRADVERIGKRWPEAITHHEEMLRQKILEVSGTVIDETKLLQEMGFYMERLDIAEEIARLKGHVQHFTDTVHSAGEIGRKLDFIIQEMVRETNTIASKSNDLFISERAIQIKVEIEKMREQVQNVE